MFSICVESTPQYRDRTTKNHTFYFHWTGDNVFLLLLDLLAAFDTVNKSLLLSRLVNSFGITGTVLQWFHSQLSGRSQFVKIKVTKSSVRDLTVGVPQCSVLGPILYPLYTASKALYLLYTILYLLYSTC